jgi:ubiquinone/menaquinone biosynthesis C-methylase UbiE
MVDMNSDSKFVQVQRVLRPGGRYLCVTLAQKHVIGMCFLSFFLSFFQSEGGFSPTFVGLLY